MKIAKNQFKQTLLPLFMVAVLLTLVINGCLGSGKQEFKTLKIGYTQWPGYDIALYAQEAGFFAKRGLEVELVPFENMQDSAMALLRGSLDAAFVSLWDAMQVDESKDSPVVTMVFNISAGSDGIVTQKSIKSVKELQGKKIGCKLGTVNELILLEALKLHDIKPENIEIESILNDIARERMKEGSLDGSVIWEPLLSNIAQEIDGNIVFTTKDVDSLVIDTLLTPASFISDRKEELTKFILGWFDVMHAVETEPDKVFATVAKQLNQSPESFASSYAGLKKGDIELQKRMFKTEGGLRSAIKEIAELLKQDRRFSRKIREDIEINSEPITAAIKAWKPL